MQKNWTNFFSKKKKIIRFPSYLYSPSHTKFLPQKCFCLRSLSRIYQTRLFFCIQSAAFWFLMYRHEFWEKQRKMRKSPRENTKKKWQWNILLMLNILWVVFCLALYSQYFDWRKLETEATIPKFIIFTKYYISFICYDDFQFNIQVLKWFDLEWYLHIY